MQIHTAHNLCPNHDTLNRLVTLPKPSFLYAFGLYVHDIYRHDLNILHDQPPGPLRSNIGQVAKPPARGNIHFHTKTPDVKLKNPAAQRLGEVGMAFQVGNDSPKSRGVENDWWFKCVPPAVEGVARQELMAGPRVPQPGGFLRMTTLRVATVGATREAERHVGTS